MPGGSGRAVTSSGGWARCWDAPPWVWGSRPGCTDAAGTCWPHIKPNPDWTPRDQAAGEALEALAATLKPEDWPLDESLWRLGNQALERVAWIYHPERAQPLLELTLPHGLLIIERAFHELRVDLADNIPLSHRLTLGDLARLNRWKRTAERLHSLYRAGRLVVNPASALLAEAKSALGNRAFAVAWTDLRRWLLQEYVRNIGHYAIALYSGRLVLDAPAANTTTAATAQSRQDLERAGAAAAQRTEEPLRILILGRSNAGKSSLINALFDQLLAATDCLPDLATGVTPYRLARDGLTPALLFDAPGLDTAGLPPKALDALVDRADLILWVTPAQRPDRDQETATLNRLRQRWAAHPARHPPTLLVAVSHIDLLRPRQEGQPPYDLNAPTSDKARNIRAAVEAVAQDLAVPLASVIPVCLAAGRGYNVTDSLWAAILDHQPDADRRRLLRLREAQKKSSGLGPAAATVVKHRALSEGTAGPPAGLKGQPQPNACGLLIVQRHRRPPAIFAQLDVTAFLKHDDPSGLLRDSDDLLAVQRLPDRSQWIASQPRAYPMDMTAATSLFLTILAAVLLYGLPW